MYHVYHIDNNEKTILLSSDDIELIGGVVVAGVGIFNELYNKEENIILDTNTDLSFFRVYSSVLIDKIPFINISNVLEPLEYGVWMKTSIPYRYDFFKYKTSEFIRGVLLMCNHYNEDIRDYIYRFPIDKYGREYDILNYHVKSVIISQDAPDSDDIEIENRDNENILEPFARESD